MDGDFIRESKEFKERFDVKAGAGSAFRSLYTSISLIQKPVIILPALIYLLIQLGLMYLYLGSHGRPWTDFWAIFSRSIDARQLGHFPQHLLLMQPLLGRAMIFLDVLVQIIFQAATVFLVATAYRARKISLIESFRVSLGRYHQLLLVSAVSAASIYGAVNLSRFLGAGLPGMLRLSVFGLGVVLALLIQVLFLYAIPLIVIDRPKTSEIFQATFRAAWKYVAPSVFIVCLPFILTMPTTFLSIKAELIAMQLSPDFMVHSHVASLIMGTVAAYLISASATIFLIRKTNERK